MKREKHRHQSSGGNGERKRSCPEGRSTVQSPAAHPAAAAAIKKQLSLQRPGDGSTHASAGERGTPVTQAIATLGFVFKNKNQ